MNLFMTALGSSLGVSLLGVLLYQARDNAKFSHLKQHRYKGAGFVDVLNYAALVDDGVLIGKNGAFMAAWLYQGDDIASLPNQAR